MNYSNLYKTYKESRFFDVKLVLPDAEYKLHSNILVQFSHYFRILLEIEYRHNKCKPVTVKLYDVKPETMNTLIEFMYTNRLNVNLDNIYDLYVLIDYLCMDQVLQMILQHFYDNIDIQNCFRIRSFALQYSNHYLQEMAERFILRNFQTIAEYSTEVVQCTIDDICQFITSDHLNVYCEEVVWNLIIKWINCDEKGRSKLITRLFPHIRLALIPIDYISNTIVTHPYVACNPYCVSILKQVYEYLMKCDNMMNIQTTIDTPIFAQPRIPHDIMFVIGGWTGPAPINIFETYDCRADRWTKLNFEDPQHPRAYHGVVALDNCIYTIGGFDGNQYFNSCRCFNVLTKEWKSIAPMNFRRCYVSVALLRGKIYAMGGYDGEIRQKTAERYNPKTNCWTLIPSMNRIRSDADCTVLDGKIYVVGGFNGEECMKSAEVYDVTLNSWFMLPNMNSRRSGVSCISYQNQIYVIGGYNGVHRLKTGERYSPVTRQWTHIADMNTPRSNFGIEVIDNTITVFGGFNGVSTISHVECYSKTKNIWLQATDMTVNRSALAACVIENMKNVAEFVHPNRRLLMEEKRIKVKEMNDAQPDENNNNIMEVDV